MYSCLLYDLALYIKIKTRIIYVLSILFLYFILVFGILCADKVSKQTEKPKIDELLIKS